MLAKHGSEQLVSWAPNAVLKKNKQKNEKTVMSAKETAVLDRALQGCQRLESSFFW